MYNGWIEDEDNVKDRTQRRKAKEYAYEVFKNSELTASEEILLLVAMDAVNTDPEHIRVCDWKAEAIAREADAADLLATQEDARY